MGTGELLKKNPEHWFRLLEGSFPDRHPGPPGPPPGAMGQGSFPEERPEPGAGPIPFPPGDHPPEAGMHFNNSAGRPGELDDHKRFALLMKPNNRCLPISASLPASSSRLSATRAEPWDTWAGCHITCTHPMNYSDAFCMSRERGSLCGGNACVAGCKFLLPPGRRFVRPIKAWLPPPTGLRPGNFPPGAGDFDG